MSLNDQKLIKTIAITCISLSITICGTLYFRKRCRYNKEYKRLEILRKSRGIKKNEDLRNISSSLENEAMTSQCINDIINKPIEELLKFLKSDKEAPNYVMIAYQKKAKEVHLKLNCLVEFVHIDKSEINENGPLYGLPISVKDNFLIKGYSSCAGCSYFLDKPVTTNSVLIDVLKDLGAVPFVKTTVPQTMMSTLSSNPIDGITLNPVNTKMSPGGSSSGEGALIGARGSIVGIGTDIGGSVRLPAAFCGVVGFKPTVGRLSRKGLLEISTNSIVLGSCGILGRDVATVSFLFEHIVNSPLHRILDPLVVPMDFNKLSYTSKEKLKIGYFTYDGSYQVVPAIKRAVLETVDLLKKSGHEVVPWKPPFNGESWLKLILTAFAANKGKDLIRICQYDKLDSSVENLLKILSWNYMQYLYHLTMCKLFGKKDMNIWVSVSRGLQTANDFFQLKSDIKSLRYKFLNEMERHNIDILICPTSGFVALPARPKGSTTGMLTYQNIWNLIDFPAGTVPVSHVTKEDIQELVSNYPKSRSMWHANTFINQKDSINLPVSVQCVSLPWREELCLRVMKEIEENLNS